MRKILGIVVFLSFIQVNASTMGVSTYPWEQNAKAITAEMNGYMNEGREVGAALRYTMSLEDQHIWDMSLGAAQNVRGIQARTGWDFNILSEDLNRPRVGAKTFFHIEKNDSTYFNYVGMAPSIRKGFSMGRSEAYPYIAVPIGFKFNNDTSELRNFSTLTLGFAANLPGQNLEKLMLSVEGNIDMGETADSVVFLASWKWN